MKLCIYCHLPLPPLFEINSSEGRALFSGRKNQSFPRPQTKGKKKMAAKKVNLPALNPVTSLYFCPKFRHLI